MAFIVFIVIFLVAGVLYLFIRIPTRAAEPVKALVSSSRQSEHKGDS